MLFALGKCSRLNRFPGQPRAPGFVLLAALIATPHTLLAELKVHFIDVGQGDAILLEAPAGNVLVDAGEPNGSARTFLEDRDIDRLDLAVATHAHFDHIGGFLEILPEVVTEHVWYNGQVHTTQAFEAFADILIELDATYHEPARGEAAEFGDLRVEVLHPTGSAADYDGHLHDESIVLRAVYREVAVLLTGDAEVLVEEELIGAGMDLRADVLKLGHHGSRTSTSADFVEAVGPALAIYQAGADNRYGHPHEEPLRVLDAAGVEVFGTGAHGTVTLIIDGESIKVALEREGAEGVAHSCIDLNTAEPAALKDIVHIDEVRAAKIVQNRSWGHVRELTRVRGIGNARLSDIKEQGLACVGP